MSKTKEGNKRKDKKDIQELEWWKRNKEAK